MIFTDKVTIDGTKRRGEDGALLVDAKVARTGVQLYAGYEVGKPELPVVRVFRSADEVFSTETLRSFAHRPITNDHPNKPVTADNWKQVAVGGTSDEVSAQGIFIRVPLMVSDGAAISAIENGKRELSAGYTCDLDFTPGVTDAGEAYDAQQRNIRANHVAIVAAGRAGKECRIGDSRTDWSTFNTDEGSSLMTTKTMTVDGLPILVTDQAEAMIVKLQNSIADAAGKLVTADAAHVAAIAVKDAEIGAFKVEIAKLKDAAITPDKVDALVKDRSELIGVAVTIDKAFKADGMTNDAIRRAIVVKKHGDDFKDASDAEISGAFKVIAKDAKTAPDSFRQGFTGNDHRTHQTDNGQRAYEDRQREAWKTGGMEKVN